MIGTAAISISGAGDVVVGGEAACAADSVSLRISGSGNVLLTLGSGDLTGRITGAGSVTYRGSPDAGGRTHLGLGARDQGGVAASV